MQCEVEQRRYSGALARCALRGGGESPLKCNALRKKFKPPRSLPPAPPFADNSMTKLGAPASSASSAGAAASAHGAAVPALQAAPAVDSSGASVAVQGKNAVKAGPTYEDFVAAGCTMSCPCRCIYCSPP